MIFCGLTIGALAAVCAIFLVADWALPEWVIVVGRWIPALVSLLMLRRFPVTGDLKTWWALRPRGPRTLLAGGAVAVGTLLAVYVGTVLAGAAAGLVDPLPAADLVPALVLLVPIILVYSVSTFGEEVAWRGYLQRLLAGWGFWRASVVIAGAWVLFHVPLHGTYAIQGTLEPHVAVGSTLLIYPLGLFLSAVVCRFGSVWPAVFAHAVPMTALNLVQDPGDLGTGAFWAMTGISAALLLMASAALAPRERASGAGRGG